MKRKPTKRAKPAEEPIHIEHFGDLIELRFHDGGSARAIYDAGEVRAILGAMQRYILRRQKIPSTKLLAAIEDLTEFFAFRGMSITITGDLFVGYHGVRLEAIIPGEDDEPDLPEK